MKNKLRLFVDCHVFDGYPQGTVTYLKGIYSNLISDGKYDIYIGALDESSIIDSFGTDGYTFIGYRGKNKFFRLGIEIPVLLKRHNIDIAHFQYVVPLFKSCKYVVTVHDLLFLDYPKEFPVFYRMKNSLLFYYSCLRSDLVLTVSNYSAESIKQKFRLKKQIIVIPNGVSVDSEIIQETVRLPFKGDFILFVSRIEPRKNQALLLKVWRKMKLYEKGIGLVLVGSLGIKDAKFENELGRLTQDENEYFSWLKRVSNGELKYLYETCRLFVYPSLGEGFGIPPIEAALHGASVICSNTTAMSEFSFFEEGLFNPLDPIELENKINTFLFSNKGSNIRPAEIIRQRYNWKSIANSFSDVISNIVIE